MTKERRHVDRPVPIQLIACFARRRMSIVMFKMSSANYGTRTRWGYFVGAPKYCFFFFSSFSLRAVNGRTNVPHHFYSATTTMSLTNKCIFGILPHAIIVSTGMTHRRPWISSKPDESRHANQWWRIFAGNYRHDNNRPFVIFYSRFIRNKVLNLEFFTIEMTSVFIFV